MFVATLKCLSNVNTSDQQYFVQYLCLLVTYNDLYAVTLCVRYIETEIIVNDIASLQL